MLPHTDIGTRGNFSIQCAGQFSDLVRGDTSLPNFPYLDDEVLDARQASRELGVILAELRSVGAIDSPIDWSGIFSGKDMMLNLSR